MPDMALPDPNTSIDTSYCVQARLKGCKVGIAPAIVYHKYKAVKFNEEIGRITNEYLFDKYGQFYFNTCVRINNVVGKIPQEAD